MSLGKEKKNNSTEKDYIKFKFAGNGGSFDHPPQQSLQRLPKNLSTGVDLGVDLSHLKTMLIKKTNPDMDVAVL